MGFLDFFTKGTSQAKAQKLKNKVTQKYGDPTVRQKAIEQLGSMEAPEAVAVLLSRFTLTVEPQTTDAQEKDRAFELICAFESKAVPPVLEFLETSEKASAWALRVLSRLLTHEEVVRVCTGQLTKIGAGYSRDPQKKLVLMGHLEGTFDVEIGPTVLPFLGDMVDDVKISALKLLAKLKYEPAREPILNLLTDGDTSKRVKMAAMAALYESEFGVQGFREKVEAQLHEPYFVDKSGAVKKRG